MNKGAISDHDFKIKLRLGAQFVRMVSHPIALYFNRPLKFDGTLAETRTFGKYSEDFKKI